MRRNRPLVALLLALLLVPSLASDGRAHQVDMAMLSVKEMQPGQFLVRWTMTPFGMRTAPSPAFPEHCTVDLPRLDCGEKGLTGRLSFEGLGTQQSASVVRVTWLDGSVSAYTLTAAQPVARIAARPGAWTEIATAYISIGFDHILLGVDHLLFVLALVWIVRSHWMLTKTITAFTVAHSLSLAAATLGWIGVPESAVNAAIALSIVFIAVEMIKIRRGQTTLTARQPWLVAFAFGLLHGFGFADALTNMGLPEASLPTALLFFNIGVEIGQLAFVALVVIMRWAYRRMRVQWPRWGEPIPAYAIGSIAAFWFFDRLSIIVTA